LIPELQYLGCGFALAVGAKEPRGFPPGDLVAFARGYREASPILLRYVQAYLNSATQSAACNRAHLLEQRLARWLLTARDRTGSDRLPLTHELIAMMLGVRRAGVTVAAQSLQSAGFIHYAHGRITIADREGLAVAACECYEVTRREYARLLGADRESKPAAKILEFGDQPRS
jgi:Crp-like helix-turn-helix domain